MAERRPAEVFPPGEFIRDELEARGWTQEDLATILGRPLQTVNAILNGRKQITPETAIGLATAFGTTAEFWLNLEAAYRLSLEKADDGSVAQRAQLFALAPIKELVRRKWIAGSNNPETLTLELKDFFGVPDLTQEPPTLAPDHLP